MSGGVKAVALRASAHAETQPPLESFKLASQKNK